MERSIQDVARLSGTTSRTLRHYDDIGLLAPSRVAGNGYRYYDETALARLQRILLLRELGLGLRAISDVLEGQADHPDALLTHLRALHLEKARLDRQIASVETTVRKLTKGDPLMAEEMFDGFDHTQHRDEVEERWGADAYATSDRWWRSMSAAERAEWMLRSKTLGSDWADAARRSIRADSAEAQQLAQRHADWLSGIPGTPGAAESGAGAASGPPKQYLLGLAEMYVADERFAANYGGQSGAEFVRDALTVFAEGRYRSS